MAGRYTTPGGGTWGRAALVLLFGGVAPIETVPEPCQRAPLHAPPATDGEWQAATFDVEDMRVHRRGERGWIQLRDVRWSADSLLGMSTSRVNGRHVPPDSTAIAWNAIEQIDRPKGRHTAMGAMIGLMAGVGAGFIAKAIEGNPCANSNEFCIPDYTVVLLLGIPIGAAIGAAVGSASRSWAPFYCAAPESPPRPDAEDHEPSSDQ